ncbi:hypothetical protein [Microbulbifer sp. ALW1]|uniref:hypothetical protein n=1 Tax=Microbulbifer sp. (strain ALW1) TaxID=1516059 RepID=UPI0013583BE1|nr:hypothetical protein [Microbulbifer sp. ALW1]
MERIKVFILGIVVYLSKPMFFALGSRWFEELQDRSSFEDRVDILRKNFWVSVAQIFIFLSLIIWYLISFRGMEFDTKFQLRITAVFIALTASLGRGGWGIQSYKNSTIIERIDRGMYKLSQFGATAVLLLALSA